MAVLAPQTQTGTQKTWNYLANLGNTSASETHPSQLETHTFWSSPAALIEISSWETLKSFFWDDWCPQCISTPLPPSFRHKVLLPAGTDAPQAPFSQSCLWSRWELCGDWCEWGAGGDERGHLKFMLLDGMGLYRFLFLRLKKKCMFTFILKYVPFLGYCKTERIALVLKNTPRASLFMQSWLWQVAATKAMSSRTWKLDMYPFHLGLGDWWGEGGWGGVRKFINESWCFLSPSISFPSYLKKITSLNLNSPYL